MSVPTYTDSQSRAAVLGRMAGPYFACTLLVPYEWHPWVTITAVCNKVRRSLIKDMKHRDGITFFG